MSQGRAEEYPERLQEEQEEAGDEDLSDARDETADGQDPAPRESAARWKASPEEETRRIQRYRASSKLNQQLMFKIRESAETPDDLESHLLDHNRDTGIMHPLQRERMELLHGREHLTPEEAVEYRKMLESNRTHTERRLGMWEYQQDDISALTGRLEEQIDHMVSERTQDPRLKRDADFKRSCAGFMEKASEKMATPEDAREILESRFRDLSRQNQAPGTSHYHDLNHRLSILDDTLSDIAQAMRGTGYDATDREEARELLEDEHARMKIKVIHELESGNPSGQGQQYQERKRGIAGILKRVVRGRG